MPFFLAAVGCSSDDSSVTTVNSRAQDSGISLPVAINTSALPANGALHAYISIDGGSRHELTIDLGSQSINGSIPGVSLGNHQFVIEVVFLYDNNTETMLGRASTSINVGTGNNNLTISSSDYVTTFDDDGDGVDNLAELNAGTDPNNPADTDCIIGTSVIGGCVLG